MSNKAVHNHERREQCAGDVGRFREETSIAPNDYDQHRQREDSEENAPAVYADAADPFPQVVALGLEYEKLVAEVGDRDVQQTRNHRGGDITVRNHRAQNLREKRVRAVPE